MKLIDCSRVKIGHAHHKIERKKDRKHAKCQEILGQSGNVPKWLRGYGLHQH
jgi:hypothetical protein